MKISEALNKSNPVVQKREMSMTEYAKLVDANTELVDQIKELKNIINKAIEFIEEHNIIGTNKEYLPSGIEKCYSLELMEILKGERYE